MRRIVLAALMAVLMGACSQIPDQVPPGQMVVAADGTPVSVSTLLGRPLALVFYRHYG